MTKPAPPDEIALWEPHRAELTRKSCPGPLCDGEFRLVEEFYVKRPRGIGASAIYSSYCRKCTAKSATRDAQAQRAQKRERARQAEHDRIELLRERTKRRGRDKF